MVSVRVIIYLTSCFNYAISLTIFYCRIHQLQTEKEVYPMCMQGKQEFEVCMHTIYSYTCIVGKLLVSLLSCASQSLRTTSFHSLKKFLHLCLQVYLKSTIPYINTTKLPEMLIRYSLYIQHQLVELGRLKQMSTCKASKGVFCTAAACTGIPIQTY